MTHRIEFTSGAKRELKNLPQDLQRVLVERIASLANEPHPPGADKIAGAKHAYRIRVGDYRIAYTVVDEHTVLVARVGHRSEVYKHIVAALNKAASKRRRRPE